MIPVLMFYTAEIIDLAVMYMQFIKCKIVLSILGNPLCSIGGLASSDIKSHAYAGFNCL